MLVYRGHHFDLVAFGRLRVQILQDLRNFFLDLDDRLGALQLVLGTRQCAAKLGILATERLTTLGFLPRSCRGQPAQYTSLAQLAPGIDRRRIQALAPQQRALLAFGVGLLVLSQDAGLVLGTELPARCSLQALPELSSAVRGIRFHVIRNFSPHSVI